MSQERHILYRALTARDPRFDGVFFVGVTSTGIYCRPICPVKTPKESTCQFFHNPQEAEQAGFRPCLRCRPELAPGSAPVDDAQRIAQLMVERIEEGGMDDNDEGLEGIAGQFELSSRQIRRIIQRELGVPPMQLILTRRLLLAKQLLTETGLPVTDIAFASGFSSLRRFNDAFVGRYRMAPSRLRKRAANTTGQSSGENTSTVQLSYRAPYDWAGMLGFLRARELRGIEVASEKFYARTVHLGDSKGWIKVTQAPDGKALLLEFTNELSPVLPAVLRRARDLFDVNACPEVINKHLRRDRLLRPLVKANPGVRVPGAFNGFEAGVRAILGQQVTVRAATTIACRLVNALCEPMATPIAELNYLTPSPVRFAKAGIDELAKYGIPRAKCRSIIALAKVELAGDLSLDDGAHHDPQAAIERLAELPGIGPWTAQYLAMRALRWPDAFPKEDLGVLKGLGGVSARQAEQMSQAWRPWRSYAVMHLWRRGAELKSGLKGEKK